MANRTLDVHASSLSEDVQSHVLFVDSARASGSNHKLVLDFEDPFTMVVGFEILDASIPNVMYSVEASNNMFSMVFSETPGLLSGANSAHIVEYMCGFEHQEALENSAVATRVVFVTPATSANVSPLRPLPPNSVYMMVTHVQGVTVSHTKNSNNDLLVGDRYFVTSDDYIDITASPASFVVNPTTMTLHKFDVVADPTNASAHVVCDLSRMDIYAEHGNYSICALCHHMNALMGAATSRNAFLPRTNVSAASCTGEFERTSKMMVQSDKPFLVNLLSTTMHKQTGFVNVAAGCTSKVVLRVNREMPLSFQCTDGMWRMPSPGVCDLTGERYIILRCPELENFNGSTFKTRTFDGVAIFKMVAGPNSISELRFDYHNLRQTLLHPIGKIGRLTFRFECGDGRPYDFKGVDYQFLACVKTLGAPRIQRFEKSILNPYYDPADTASVPVIGGGGSTDKDATDWDYLDKLAAELDMLDVDGGENDDENDDDTNSVEEYDLDARRRASNAWDF